MVGVEDIATAGAGILRRVEGRFQAVLPAGGREQQRDDDEHVAHTVRMVAQE